jgi:hypothetical protein
MKKTLAVMVILATVMGTVAMARSRRSADEKANAVIDARLHELLLRTNQVR